MFIEEALISLFLNLLHPQIFQLHCNTDVFHDSGDPFKHVEGKQTLTGNPPIRHPLIIFEQLIDVINHPLSNSANVKGLKLCDEFLRFQKVSALEPKIIQVGFTQIIDVRLNTFCRVFTDQDQYCNDWLSDQMVRPFEICDFLIVLEQLIPLIRLFEEFPEISIYQQLFLGQDLMLLLCLLVEFVLEEVLKLVCLELQIKVQNIEAYKNCLVEPS